MQKSFLILALVCAFGLTHGAPSEPALGTFTAEDLEIIKQHKVEVANKIAVRNFLQGLMGDKDLSVIDKYVHPDYIQHLPSLADGIEALKEMAVEFFPPTAPKTLVNFLRMGADGNLVFVHLKSKRKSNPLSVMHIFRCENSLLMEHWEISAELTPEMVANAKNPHPLF